MKNTKNHRRFRAHTLLLAFLVAGLLGIALGACNTDTVLTPEEKIALDQREANAKAARDRAKVLEKEGIEAGQAAVDAARAGDVAAAEAAKKLVAEKLEAWQREIATWRGELKAADAIEDQAQQRAMGPLLGLAAAHPTTAGAVALLGPLAMRLMFNRSRKRLRDAMLAAGSFDLGEALRQILASMGVQHSTNDPEELLAAVEALASKSENPTLALAVRDFRGELRAGAYGAAVTYSPPVPPAGMPAAA